MVSVYPPSLSHAVIRLVVFENFVTEEEGSALIEFTGTGMERSMVSDGPDILGELPSTESVFRTSAQKW